MTDKWGAPLQGEQMQALRDAGLPDGTIYEYLHSSGRWIAQNLSSDVLLYDRRIGTLARLPADHPAYTLLNAGWLDGRNVALWFGGDKAPDDCDGQGFLTENGLTVGPFTWTPGDEYGLSVIAYTRKAEHREEAVKACQSFDDTVTLNKMTETEVRHRIADTDWTEFPVKMNDALATLKLFGLIKPEPTIEERFREKFPAYVKSSDWLKGWVKLALEFERV